MRLIDADALNKKLCETTIFIEDGEVFQRMINDAPTIEPDTDTISRQDAINAIENTDAEITAEEWDELTNAIKSLPSAQAEKSEIIMCKDCKYYKAKQNGLPWNNSRRYCNRSVTIAVNSDDFCSYGERAEK